MSVVDDDEEQFRDQLDEELGELVMSPAPMDAILGDGRRYRLERTRRRTRFALCGVAVLGVAGSVLGLLLQQGPATPDRATGDVSVNSLDYDQSRSLIGSGTVYGHPWTVSVARDADHEHALMYEETSDGYPTFQGVPFNGVPVDPSSPLGRLSAHSDSYDSAQKIYLIEGEVPSYVSRVDVRYADGETVSVPAAESYGQRVVAFAGSADVAVTRATVYDAAGVERGYSIPFNPALPGPIFSSWYAPGQTAPQNTQTLTDASYHGAASWSIEVQQGAFGTCATVNMVTVIGTGKMPTSQAFCLPKTIPAGPTGLSELINSVGGPDTLPACLVGLVDPAVHEVKAVFTDGTSATVTAQAIGDRSVVATMFSADKQLKTLSSYSAKGVLLATVAVS